jgi:hypothetical protein
VCLCIPCMCFRVYARVFACACVCGVFVCVCVCTRARVYRPSHLFFGGDTVGSIVIIPDEAPPLALDIHLLAQIIGVEIPSRAKFDARFLFLHLCGGCCCLGRFLFQVLRSQPFPLRWRRCSTNPGVRARTGAQKGGRGRPHNGEYKRNKEGGKIHKATNPLSFPLDALLLLLFVP